MADPPAHRVLVFGGTFDPPHLAHSVLPPQVAEAQGCGRILYIPNASNPLKRDPPTEARHRLAMLELTVAGVPNAEIMTAELDRPGPSYTVDTLRSLHDGDPGSELMLLLGADAALTFPQWREPETILRLATPGVMLRPPWDVETLRDRLEDMLPPEQAAQWVTHCVDVGRMDISASELRDRLRRGDDVSDALHASVVEYIREHGLYGVE